MMIHGYRHHGRKSGGMLWQLIVSVVVLIGGGFLVYFLIGWFRSTNEETIAEAEASTMMLSGESTTPTILDGSAAMTLVGGGSAGVVYRRGTSERAEYNTVLMLPALLPETSYEMWMVKDGLVDVQSAGTLTVRADGSFSGQYALLDPGTYSTVVIMLEPNDGVATPSGTIVAQGTF